MGTGDRQFTPFTRTTQFRCGCRAHQMRCLVRNDAACECFRTKIIPKVTVWCGPVSPLVQKQLVYRQLRARNMMRAEQRASNHGRGTPPYFPYCIHSREAARVRPGGRASQSPRPPTTLQLHTDKQRRCRAGTVSGVGDGATSSAESMRRAAARGDSGDRNHETDFVVIGSGIGGGRSVQAGRGRQECTHGVARWM